MNALETKIGDEDAFTNIPIWHLDKARALANTNEWKSAAAEYSEYLKYDSNNWEVYFLQGVAYQNSREGNHTNLAALRAYSEAIVLAPNDIDTNTRARLFAYKGAALKRLERLIESESDLLIAKKIATREYEIADIAYNLACVYAMTKNKDEMLKNIKIATKYSGYKIAIQAHRDYFDNYWEDRDFQLAIR
jgi:tetratricopeptide (TPR) repeat protein